MRIGFAKKKKKKKKKKKRKRGRGGSRRCSALPDPNLVLEGEKKKRKGEKRTRSVAAFLAAYIQARIEKAEGRQWKRGKEKKERKELAA